MFEHSLQCFLLTNKDTSKCGALWMAPDARNDKERKIGGYRGGATEKAHVGR